MRSQNSSSRAFFEREQLVDQRHHVDVVAGNDRVELSEKVIERPLAVDLAGRVKAEGAAIGTRPAGDHVDRARLVFGVKEIGVG